MYYKITNKKKYHFLLFFNPSLYQEIMNFLKNYIYIKNFDYFVPNQPINLQLNKTLYLFHIFYKFYEYIVDVNIKDEKITITLNMQKMNIFENMKEFVNNIIEELGKSFQKIDEQTEKKINFFFLCFKIEPTENNLKNLQKNIDNMLSQMSQLTPKKIELFLENNKELKSFLSLENESLILKTKAKEYKFNIEVYNDTILTSIKSNYKFLNLNKALIILNPLSYEKEFTNFKENFNREKTVTKKEMADELIEYLKKIGLETSDYNNKKKDYNKYVIDCSKKYEKTYHIVYHSENHCLK